MSPDTILLFVLLGILAGSLSGLLGIGGGVILVPALVFIFGMTEHVAQGTTLALMVPPIGLLAAWHYYKKGHVDLRVAGLVCLGFVGGGLIGATVATELSNAVLQDVFGVGLVLIALKMLFGHEHVEPHGAAIGAREHRRIDVRAGVLFVALGLLAGVVSGLLGLGGGIILVPALVFVFRMPQHEAQGTTLALMVPPIGLLAAWQYYHNGDVNLPVSALICVGFFFGALAGAKLAGLMSSRILSRVFGVAMLIVAMKMLL